MAFFKFATDLFLEVAEMNAFKKFLDDQGFRRELLENSVSFGLIKSAADVSFANGKVQRDIPNSLGQQTVKLSAVHAIDSNGNFIEQAAIGQVAIPGDGNWYWIKVAHQYTTQELGTVSVDASGNLVGVGTQFTQILRGNPNFPSRIKFIGSTGNVLEYDVLSITDDTHAIVVHPAISVGGNAVFNAESNLGYEVVGTFTPLIAVSDGQKFPNNYDSCNMSIEVEASLNVRPTYTIGQEFFLARVQVANGQLIIQDKRLDYWETKGSNLAKAVTRTANPLVGVEQIQWENKFTVSDHNRVFVGWGMRSDNWSVDTVQNLVTMNAGNGGSYKSTSAFTNGNFDGWRLYTSNGNYRTVVSSVKQGGSINLFLDMLDIDDFSNDGGVTLIAQTIVAVPDAEEIELSFTANAQGVSNVNKVFTLPISSGFDHVEIPCYGDPTCLYNVKYAYKSFKELTVFRPLVSGSYLTEVSFDLSGNLLAPADQVTHTYVSDPTVAYIQLTISPNAFERFSGQVYKGDLIGVNTINSFSAGQVLQLVVGSAARYQHIIGNISITDDIFISLSRQGAVAGNTFTIHFNCTSLNMGSNHIIIADNYTGGTLTVVKTFGQGDAYHMLNADGGVVIECTFDGSQWIAYQTYEQGKPFEVIHLDGDPSAMFDLTNGMGKLQGYFGYCLCNAARSVGGVVIPNLADRFIVAAGSSYGATVTGGEATHILTLPEAPAKTITIFEDTKGGTAGVNVLSSAPADIGHGSLVINVGGGGQAHNNLPPYYAMFMAKRVF